MVERHLEPERGALDEADFDSIDELADHARVMWAEQMAAALELSVSVELEEWATEGRFGTGERQPLVDPDEGDAY